jgi:hypothetical protein
VEEFRWDDPLFRCQAYASVSSPVVVPAHAQSAAVVMNHRSSQQRRRRTERSASAGGFRRATKRRVGRLLSVVVGDAPSSAGPVVLAVVIVTAVFYSAIRRHDVELTFDQLSEFERHVQSFGNKTVYVVNPNRVDSVLSSLSHDDWTKVSSKIDYVAFVYDDAFSLSGSRVGVASVGEITNGGAAADPAIAGTMQDAKRLHIDNGGASGGSGGSSGGDHSGNRGKPGQSDADGGSSLMTLLLASLESVEPHGYGVVLFGCGCVVHNVLFQHVSTRFDGHECALLPGFIMEPSAVRWVDGGSGGEMCTHGRDTMLKKPWYWQHSRQLEAARRDFSGVKQHLLRTQHPDRPFPPPDGGTKFSFERAVV